MVTPSLPADMLPARSVEREGNVRAPQRLVHINIGPQHPSTHGVLRLKVVLDGEVVRKVDPVIGYLHRSVEKLGEDGSYLQFIHLTDRLDYLEAMNNNHAFCHAVERLGGVTVPERAEYIRVIALETNRIASHLLWLGTFGLDVGAMTPFFWCMRDREHALGLLEKLSGARLTYNWIRIGGVKNDLPAGFLEDLQDFVDYMPKRLDELDNLLAENDIFQVRTQGIGVLTREVAWSYGVTGPMLRSTGLAHDLRREQPYSVYPKLDFRVPTGRGTGDCYDRFLVRMAEMRESVRILQQCIEQIPAKGEYVSPDVGEGPRQHRYRPAEGDGYFSVESARGEMGCYIVSDGTNRPYRLKWRAPTLSNLSPLAVMTEGLKIPDLVATLGSIDIVLGDIDR